MLNQYRFHAGQFSVPLIELKLTGEDVESFLQTQSTFDVSKLEPHSFHLASFLDPQGRVECYGWILKDKTEFSFLVPELILDQTIARLNKFLISEDVTISDPHKTEILVIIGPKAHEHVSTKKFKGEIFGEEAYIQFSSPVAHLNILDSNEVETWRGLTGWPSFDGSDYSHQIINNLRLFDLSVVMNKGCYPGQETVSKIATRRGAAYSPVLVEVTEMLNPGEVESFDKKIGTAHKCLTWEGKFYLASDFLRDFRVAGMKIHFKLNGKEHDGLVRYYPLISGSSEEKSRELFYAGSEYFMRNDYKTAEEKFRMAIELDPKFGDAYESLGVMLGRLDRYPEAIEIMQKLSEVDPTSVLAHTNMSLFLMKMGKITEAEEQKSQATIKSFQMFGAEAKSKEAEEARKKAQQNEWAQRESMFEQVLEIDPEDTLANYGLGSIAVERGDWEKARVHLEKVLEADPKYSVAYLALGRAYKGLGKIEDAKRIWKEGIQVSAAKGDLMPANQMQQELGFL